VSNYQNPVNAALDRLATTVICQRCGATGETYGFDTCVAELDERCEGFDTVERMARALPPTPADGPQGEE